MALAQFGVPEETMLAKGLGIYTEQTEFVRTPPCASHRGVVLEVYLN
jgi:hypothetical protein